MFANKDSDQRNLHSIQKMLKKIGSEKERIYFSDYVVKINRKQKEQVRFLLITDGALYNLLPNNLSRCRRRISVEKIVSISISKLSDEFVLHVLDEYDYRYKSNKKDTIKRILSDLYAKKTQSKLLAKYIANNTLGSLTLTKKQLRMQSREEKLLRRERFFEIEENDSDKEDENNKMAESAENILEPDKKIGLNDFTLLKVLGRGSFGKVLQVRKRDTGNVFAMKILKKKGLYTKNQVEHTKAERKILSAFNHPFLMKLRFAFQTKKKLYIVLDFYKGGELFFHLKKKNKLSEAEARFIAAETVLAISHLHSNEVLYRDLKPENVLLDESGHICLTDFGLSKIFELEEDKHTMTFCGTPEYLAPEVIEAKPYSKEVDWWSLGIFLYEMMVGFPPFYSKEIHRMYKKIQEDEPNFPKSLSSNSKDLISRLLIKNSAQRLGSGEKDSREIMDHPFFKKIDWELLEKKLVTPPYIPKTNRRMSDTTNFDKEFTSEPVADSEVDSSSLRDDEFEEFSYAGPLDDRED